MGCLNVLSLHFSEAPKSTEKLFTCCAGLFSFCWEAPWCWEHCSNSWWDPRANFSMQLGFFTAGHTAFTAMTVASSSVNRFCSWGQSRGKLSAGNSFASLELVLLLRGASAHLSCYPAISCTLSATFHPILPYSRGCRHSSACCLLFISPQPQPSGFVLPLTSCIRICYPFSHQ